MHTPTPTPSPHDVPVTVRWLNPIGCSMFDAPIADLLHGIKQPSTHIEVVSFDMQPSPKAETDWPVRPNSRVFISGQ